MLDNELILQKIKEVKTDVLIIKRVLLGDTVNGDVDKSVVSRLTRLEEISKAMRANKRERVAILCALIAAITAVLVAFIK